MIVCLLVLAAVAPSLMTRHQLSRVEQGQQLPKYGQLTGPERPDPGRFDAAHYLIGPEQTALQNCCCKDHF